MRYLRSILLGVALLAAAVSPAWAAPATGGSIVNFADTVVPAGTTVDSVVVVGGNATIAGTVKDEVFVVNGNVTLASTANIRDRLIVLGGNISADDGAYVRKGVFSIGGDFAMATTLISAGFLLLLLWFINIAVTAGLIIIPTALAWGFKRKIQEMADIIRDHTIKTVLVGLLAGLAAFIAAFILALTIFGIPVAILLMLLVLLVGIYGLGGVCCEIGRRLPFAGWTGEQGILLRTLCGAVLLALAFNLPLIGLVVLKLSLLTGFGAVILKITAQKEKAE